MGKASPSTAIGQFFEVHGSKFKLHPVGNLSQASILRMTHGVFFLGVCKDPFNGLFSPLVQFLVLWSITGVVGQFLIILPDMPLYALYTVLGAGTQMAGGDSGYRSWGRFCIPGIRPGWWCGRTALGTPGR